MTVRTPAVGPLSRFRRRGTTEPLHFADVLLENLADPVVACDAAGKLVIFNRRAREIHGAAPKPVRRDRWAEHYNLWRSDGSRLLTPEEIPLFRALAGEVVQDAELLIRPGDGDTHLMSVNGGPVRGPGGDIRGAIVVMHDITGRVRAEDRARVENDALANMVDGMALVRAADGVIVYVSPGWNRMLGYDEGELEGKHVSAVSAPEPVPGQRLHEITTSLDRDGIWRGEVKNVRKDGAAVRCAASISSFEHPRHGTLWIAVISDLTAPAAEHAR